MWKYYVTEDNCFWDKGTTDKPSRHYLEKVMQWEPLDMNLNLKEMGTTQIMLNKDSYSLIKAVNDENNTILYFMLIRCLKYVENGYLLEYELDTWCSYTLPITEQDINVLVDRHQDYNDDKKLEFENNTFDLSFDEYTVFKKEFKNNESLDGNYNIKCDSLINGVYCFVFNDSPRNNFMFIPLLSTSDKPIVECKIDTTTETHVVSHNEHLPINNSYSIYSYSFGNKLLDYNRRGYKIYQDFKVINKQTNQTEKLSLSSRQFNFTDESFYNSFWVIKKLNNIEVRIEWWRNVNGKDELWTQWNDKIPNSYSWLDIYIDFTITYGRKPYKYSVDNTIGGLTELVKSRAYGGQFEGVYIIPNVLNLTSLWDFENIDIRDNPSQIKPSLSMLTLKIDEQGVNLPIINLLDDLKIDRNYRFNSEIPLDETIYKKFDFYWYDNKIDISKLVKNEKVDLIGTINFTNTFNLKFHNKLINIENSLLSFPSKQPFRFNEYWNYVKNNMNTINTGYAIQKQQSIISGVQGGFNSILGGVIGSSISGNPLGFLSGLGSLTSNTASSVLGLKNYEKQIQAKYADLDSQLGNKIIFGASSDAKWCDYINKNFNYETFILKKLSTDSIIRLNNDFLLNGVYNPKYFKLNALPETTKHLGFKYAKLNSTNFNQIFSKYINSSMRKKEIILSELQEFRIWDKIPSIE